MTDETLELQKKVKVLEQQLAEKEKIIKDPSKRGYYAFNKILLQQIEYLEDFDLRKEIGQNPKEDKVYDRVKGIWEGLKTMIMDGRILKQELHITLEEEKEEMKKLLHRTTPEAIADAMGNTAGQLS